MTTLGVDFPVFEPGWVWLVGAGPGDPGLLTLHAVNAMQQADVVVYDALVDDRILNLLRSDAERIYAGKRGGRPSSKQTDISLQLVELAKQGLRVLRLKGGDPFVFGRGGEEGMTLVDHNVPFRVVPGITAGIAGAAYAGIPTTHRDCNSSVTFVTGHGSSGEVPDNINWGALAKGAPVLVMYMAMKHLRRISSELIANGRAPDEPLAVISQATTPGQGILITTLGKAADDVERQGVEPPAVCILGKVVGLRDRLNWLSPQDDVRAVRHVPFEQVLDLITTPADPLKD
ncbi:MULTISPECIES: uroporphyrinogen-III C-methyltransferase [Thalassospira]|uniref:uroporphyrinogen-III C-methyltransferase n=1 Tax=Thalassospira profundimaris TaxID=502049 RepID=A0A367VIE9_9PROT|nr:MULTISPECIES: uroporphyrinogen-III C-methyltransferase [Thalassospira]KZB71635.1 uroporphyrin-III methyltransferase [Thalassospira sp. MCCC 1A01148]MBR9898606.1 uroporphyrinogen-III C-methyltransferase [Rhodospirillales bacterium]RCK24030.1 uroporphyrin-III methyltransferase [Thalassospira profundimaris]